MKKPPDQPTFDQLRLRALRIVVRRLDSINVTPDEDLKLAHVRDLADEYLAFGRFADPPHVTVSGKIIHGRHRIAAARLAGATVLNVEEYADGIAPELVREAQLSVNLIQGWQTPAERSRDRAEFDAIKRGRMSGNVVSGPEARKLGRPKTTAATAEELHVDPTTIRRDKALVVFSPTQSKEMDEDGWTKAERVKLAKRLKSYPAGTLRGQVFAGALSARRDERRTTEAKRKADDALKALGEKPAAPKTAERKDLAGRVLPPTAIMRWAEATAARAIYIALSDDLDAWDKFAEGASTFTAKSAREVRDGAARFLAWLGYQLGYAWCPDCGGSGRRQDGRADKRCRARGFLTQGEWELRAGDEMGGHDDD